MKRILVLLSLISSAVPFTGFTQSYLGVGADFGIVLPRGMWAQTYGSASQVGVRIEAANKVGLLATGRGDLLFGNTLKVDPLATLRTEVGILGDESDRARPVNVPLKARGYSFSALIGYQRLFGTSPLGWRVMAGPSYTSHKIRIQDDATLTTSNLRTEYKRGYDRRAGGVGGYAEGGVIFTQPDRQITVFLMASLNVFGSKPLRSTQFDIRTTAPMAGTDAGLGLKLGLTTALFRPDRVSEAEDIYY